MIAPIRAVLFDVAAGDALGVPVEFRNRVELLQQPVSAMTGFGTHGQPAGTWSDDSSLTFCLAEALTQRYDLRLIADYVLHTLEAAIWSILTTDDYQGAVLKAVNLGSDTDTTGAVAGGLAALLYGYGSIPAGCIAELARQQDIARLAQRMAARYDQL
ncbi:ADP-ribosylglycohydrolase family protein [Chitinophaga pendula]|nr:hypothetical protein CK934_08635 [Chitinophaga sp. MD30]UCJ10314.1 ADP-ribosylglycohydrolase family protein [Chitinophaga pendula]